MRYRLLPIVLCSLIVAGWAAGTIRIGSFSQGTPGGLPGDWEPLRLGDAAPSDYALVRDGEATVLRARADDSASGLVRRVRLDPQRYPVLAWRWKIDGVIPGGDLDRKAGDDCPARVYVTFDYDPGKLSFGERIKYEAVQALGGGDVPLRALNYVWANLPGETRIVENAFTDWVMMVPLRSGPADAGTWQAERRNIVEDYRRAFGEDPPPISGIAVMTDADNTDGAATAYYGDITLHSD